MDSKTLNTVIVKIHRRFPEFLGVKPKVKRQQPEGNGSPLATPPAQDTYLLTFHTTVLAKSGNGKRKIPRWVRVVVRENGKIIKVTTSR
jgi:hypothetical protein